MLLKRNLITSFKSMHIRNRSWVSRLISKENKKDEKKNNKKSNKLNVNDFKNGINVGIVGGGMVAIHTAVLLKQHQVIKNIHLIDPKDKIEEHVLDANQIDTSTRIKYYSRKDLEEALQEVSIIALMNENEFCFGGKEIYAQFKKICGDVRQITEEIVEFSPSALLVVFTRPVTAMLPMVSEIYKLARLGNPARIIGSTALESMRLEAMTATFLDLDPAFLSIPIVAGGDPSSIVPLFSRAKPINQFTAEQTKMLVNKLRYIDKELANAGSKGPILSSAAAATSFILTLIAGLSGSNSITGCAFVRSSVVPACKFFTNELQFGPNGFEKNFGLPKISPTEISMVTQAIPLINEYTEMGISAVYDRAV